MTLRIFDETGTQRDSFLILVQGQLFSPGIATLTSMDLVISFSIYLEEEEDFLISFYIYHHENDTLSNRFDVTETFYYEDLPKIASLTDGGFVYISQIDSRRL